MMYDEYVEKIKKLSNIKNKIYKFRFLILGVLAVIIATVTTLLSIKGNTSELLLPENITYGEKYDASCSALMSSIIGYEHKLEGTDTWEQGLPDKPGDYVVRAVSQRSFGSGYSEEKKISIAKRELKLELENKTITYGDYPRVKTTNLATNDKITNYVFTFDDLTKNKTLIDISLQDITIKNTNDEVVTSCYNITYNKEEISFNKKAINITPNGANKVYDGEPLVLPNTYTLSSELGYDDKITVSSYEVTDQSGTVMESVVNPGRYNLNITSYDIQASNGSTLGNYNAKLITTPLTIEKRNITVNTSSSSHEYDGLSHKSDAFELANGSTLAKDNNLVLDENNTSITHFGEVTNRLSVKVLDSNNTDISSFYNINYNYGKLNVTKKTLTININSLDITYDGENHSEDTYEVLGLVQGDQISSLSGVNSFRDVGEYINSFTINMNNIDDYSVVYTNGTIKINKKDIQIKPINRVSTYGDEITYNQFDYIDINNALCESDDPSTISITVSYYKNGESITPKDVGSYDIKVESYNSYNYNVISNEFGTHTIEKRELNITLYNKEDVVFDGILHPYDYDEIIEYHRMNSTLYPLPYVLPYEEELKLELKYNDSFEIPYDANEYIVSFYDYDIEGGSKDNYIVNCNNTTTFSILKKNIDITPLTYENKTYDGEELRYLEGTNNFVEADTLCSDDKINITIRYEKDGLPVSNAINAGYYVIYVDNYQFISGNENNYQVNILSTTFEIYRREITLMPNEIESKTYDGIEVTYDNRTPIIENGSFADGEAIEIESVIILGDNNQTIARNADRYRVIITELKEVGQTLMSNYDISLKENEFKIYERDIKFNLKCDIENKTKEYDGIYYYYEYEIDPETPIVLGEDLVPEILYEGIEYGDNEIRNVDTYEVRFGTVAAFNTLLTNYSIDSSDIDHFVVTPKHIENITPINFANKIYDGLYYEYEIRENNFVEYTDLIAGDGITIYVIIHNDALDEDLTAVKDAGDYSIKVIDYAFTSGESRNYIIDDVDSESFKIDKRDVKVLLDKTIDSKVYDGDPYIYSYDVDNIITSETIEVELSYLGREYKEEKILYVDTYDISISSIIENEYVKNYNIDITDTHVFIVEKKPVEIRPINLQITYGDQLYYDQNDYKFVSGELTAIDDYNAISINVAYYKNDTLVAPKNAGDYEIRITSHSSRNYDVTYSTSSLRIVPFDLYIELKKMTTVTYDGLTHNYYDEYSNYLSNQTLPYEERIKVSVTYNDSYDLPKNADTYIIKYDDFEVEGESKDNYNIICNDEITFIINRRPISISPKDIPDKEYDGLGVTYIDHYSNNDFDIVEGSMVEGEFFTIDEIIVCYLNGQKIPQAINANFYLVKIEDISNIIEGNTNTLKSNYSINYSLSTQFTINPRKVKLTLTSDIYEKEYDGLEYTAFNFSADRLVGSEKIKPDIYFLMVSEYGDTVIRNAGTYNVSMVVPGDDDHYYDGAMITNYDVDYTEVKKFTVTKKALSLEFTYPSDDVKIYDGESISNDVYKFSITGLVTAYDKLNIDPLFNNSKAVPKDVDTYTITFDLNTAKVVPAIENATYDTRIDNYEITTNSIIYSIGTRNIRFYLDSDIYAKQYDGIEYTGFEAKLDTQAPYLSIVDGETITPKINYQSKTYAADKTLRNAGVYDVSLAIDSTCFGTNTKSSNYNITLGDSKEFEIAKINLSINYVYSSINENYNEIYNNKEIDVNVVITGQASSDTITANVTYNDKTNKPKDAGDYLIHITGYKVTPSTSRIENYNYTTPDDFTYVVKKRTLEYNIINSLKENEIPVYSIIYDGNIYSSKFEAELSSTCDGYALNEEAIKPYITFDGHIYHDTYLRNSDIYDVSYKVDFKDFKSENYEVIYKTSIFTINQKPLNVTFGSDSSKTYDGSVIPDEILELNYAGLVASDEIKPTYSFNGELTNPKDAGTYTILAKTLEFSISSELSDYETRKENYSISNIDELIYIIHQKKVTIKAKEYTNKYDGKTYNYNYFNPNLTFEYYFPDGINMPSNEAFKLKKVSLMLGEDLYTSVKDANEYKIYIAPEDVLPDNDDTKLTNYEITIDSNRKFIILKRKIEFDLISNDENGDHIDSREYDGTVYEFEYEEGSNSEGFATGENIKPIITYSGDHGETEIKEIGKYTVKFEQDLTKYELTNASLNNYIIDISAQATFYVTKSQIVISLKNNQSKIYDGIAYTYDGEDYLSNKSKDLLLEYGLVVYVDYYDGNDEYATPLTTVKNAGTYYLKINETQTRSLFDSIQELKDNFELIISDQFFRYDIDKLIINMRPTHYEENDIDKFSNKTYDRLAYDGYDSTKYRYSVDETQEGHDIPTGEGFTIITKISSNESPNDSNVIYAKNADTYTLKIDNVGAIAGTNINNYQINRKSYTFTIDRAKVSIGLKGERDGEPYYLDKEYDGESYDPYDVAKDSLDIQFEKNQSAFEDIVFAYSAAIIKSKYPDSLKNAQEYRIVIDQDSFDIVNDDINNYNVKLVTYEFEISPRPVEITLIPNTRTKVYDGFEFNYDGTYIVSSEKGFIGNTTLYIALKGKRSQTGFIETVPILYAGQYEILFDDENSILYGDELSNYEITQSNTVEFTVRKREVDIKTATSTLVYNGKEQYDASYEVTSDLGIAPYDVLIPITVTKVTYVNNNGVSNNITYKIRYADGHESGMDDGSYSINVVRGRLTVTKKNISLVSKSAELVYNGSKQILPEFESIDEICEDDRVVFKESSLKQNSSLTYVGSIQNVLQKIDGRNITRYYTINNKYTGDDVTDNYNISYSSGTLSIVQREVTIVGYSDVSKEYTGKNPTITKSSIIFADGSYDIIATDNPTITVENAPINVGVGIYNVSVTIKSHANCYIVHQPDNSKIQIEITPRKVTLTTASNLWEYDGTYHKDDSYTDLKRIITGDKLVPVSSTTIKDVGTANNVIEFKVFDSNNNDITSNYSIQEEFGILEIVNGINVNIKIKDLEYTRNLAQITVSDVTLYSPDGYDISLYTINNLVVNTVNGATEVGNDYIANINYSYVNTSTGNEYFKENVEVTFNIIPISLNITIKTIEKEFTGQRYGINANDYTITSGALLPGDTLLIIGDNEGYTGTIKVGLKDYIVLNGTNNVSANYNVEAKKGKITINKIPLTITTKGKSFNYDLTEHYFINYTIDSDTLSQYGLHEVVSTYQKITNPGKISNKITFDIVDSLNRTYFEDPDGYVCNYSKAFNLNTTYGNLIVNAVEIKISQYQSPLSYEYDGTVIQSDSSILVAMANNEDITSLIHLDVEFQKFYEPTFVKVSNPFIVNKITDLANNDITKNFSKITIVTGEIEIRQAEIFITTLGANHQYDGNTYKTDGVLLNNVEMTRDGDTFSANYGLFKITLIDDSSLTEVGTTYDTYRNLVILDSNNNDVTRYFKVTVKCGYIRIYNQA